MIMFIHIRDAITASKIEIGDDKGKEKKKKVKKGKEKHWSNVWLWL